MPERDITLQMGVNSKEAIKAMNDFENAAKKLSQILSHTSQPSKELRETFSKVRKTSSEYNSVLRKLQGDTDKYTAALSKQVELEQKLDLQRRSLANKKERTNQFIDKRREEARGIKEQIQAYKELIARIKQYEGNRSNAARGKISSAAKKANIELTDLPKTNEGRIEKINSLLDEQIRKQQIIETQIKTAKLNYEKQAQSVQNTSNKLDEQKNKVDKLKSSLGEGTSKLAKYAQDFAQNINKLNVQNIFNNVKNSVKGVITNFQKLVSLVRKAFGLISKLSGISSIFKGFKSSMRGNNMELKDGIRYLIQYGLGFRSLYFLVRKLRSTFVEALQDMGKSVPQVQASLDSLSKSMNSLKGGLAVSFAPLLKYVAALMERLAAIAIRAANAIAQFFAVLTGQNVWFKLSEGASGYTSAVKGSTKATKENEKAMKKQLAAFDDIDVLVKDLDDDLEDVSPGGGGGIDASELGSWQEMFNPVSELAELIRKAWASDDTLKAFEEVGQYIGKALEKALGNLLTDFWPSLRAKTEKVALAIAGTINGFFQTDAVVLFAKNIAAALNTALSTLSKYWNGVNWGNMGRKLSESIIALIEDIEWRTLVEYLTGKINGLITLAWATVGNGEWITLAWQKITDTFYQIITNIDWIKLGETLNAAISAFLEGAILFIQNNREAVRLALQQFLESLHLDELILLFVELVGEALITLFQLGITALQESEILGPLLLAALAVIVASALAGIPVLGVAIGSALVAAIGLGITDNLATVQASLDYVLNYVVVDNAGNIWAVGSDGGATLMQGMASGVANNGQLVWNEHTHAWDIIASDGVTYGSQYGQLISGTGDELVGIISEKTGLAESEIKEKLGFIETNTQETLDTISTDVDETMTTVEEKTNTSMTAMEEDTTETMETMSTAVQEGMDKMEQEVSDAASAIASTPIRPEIDTSSIDAGIAKLNEFLSLAAQAGSASASVSSMSSIKANISHNTRSISALAKGGVIPPNKPFLAMLGDQRSGTNVEAPLSTITQALHDALNTYGFSGGGSQEIVLNIDGTTLARLTVPHNLKELNRQGYNVKLLERK